VLIQLETGDSKPLDTQALGHTVHGVAGIGHPARFFDTLRDLGFEVIVHEFDDHHLYSLTDLMFNDSLPVIMTEKDAVKVSQLNSGLLHSNFWYLRINASMPAEFMPQLLHKIQGVRGGATNVENQANNGDQHVS
jgi:tetraacyldisaccharide 4'-kinase